MRNYQRTSTSMFIDHFALSPQLLVCLRWDFVLRILSTSGRSGANFSPGGRIIQKVICKNPWSSIPLVLVIWRTVLFANDHLQRNRGGQIIQILPLDFGHQENRPIWKRPFAKERKSTEEAGSSGWSFATIPAPPSPCFWSSGEPSSLQMTICKGREEHGGGQIIRMIIFKGHWYLRHWYMMVLSQYRPVLAAIWWYWVSMGLYWLVLGDTGSV